MTRAPFGRYSGRPTPAMRVHHVDAQLAAQLAVVALLGLLQVAQVLVQLLLA